jgi:hypothetical protein
MGCFLFNIRSQIPVPNISSHCGNELVGHLVAGGVERVFDFFADQGQNRDDDQSDERNQQPVFDQRLTFFFKNETIKQLDTPPDVLRDLGL